MEHPNKTGTQDTMKAYHGDPEVKLKYLDRVRAHRKADQLVQGYGYWKHGKGCAVGCTIHDDEHSSYETQLGIPEFLARLEDGIFEGLSVEDARLWPEQFLDAIPTGADLSIVWPRFAHWLLVDPLEGVIRFAKTEAAQDSITQCGELYKKWIAGDKPSRHEWLKAKSSTYTYADDAAAYAAADAAAAAAYAASGTAGAYTTKLARKSQSIKLLQLLSESVTKL